MKASQIELNQYLIKNIKLTENKDKELKFREIWQDIFKISQQETPTMIWKRKDWLKKISTTIIIYTPHTIPQI